MPGMRIDKYVIARPEDDKRVKLLEADKEEVRKYRGEGWSMRQLAAHFNVSRRTIQFVIYPERMKQINYSGHWKKYYDRQKNTEYMRKHRARKKQLLLEGKLKQVREKPRS